jgi:SAM-dependent methyltransferase
VSFEVEADAYDRYMGAWSAPLSPQLAALARVRRGMRALDVGCGPGALTAELARRLGPASVAGVDPSSSFVVAARDRVPGADIRQASAEGLPFADAAFDASLTQLAVHFMPDPVRGLAEMARVTRAGGVVAACVWDFAGGHGPLGPFWPAARAIDPSVADESDLPGTRDGHLVELLTVAGLRSVRQEILSVERRYPTFDDWWQPFTRGVGPGGAYVSRLDPQRRIDLREQCRAMLPDGPFTITARAWAARGIT